ncbi:MAG: DUF3592 domain-containing protein [Planctomycetota bacterium]
MIYRLALACVLLSGASVFGFIAYVGLSREFAPIFKARAARDWPVTQGRISEASAFFWREKRSPGKGRALSGYLPHVRYHYTVDGRDYVGDRLRFTSDYPELLADEQQAAALVAPFQAANSVEVYYEPSDPADATLKPTYRLSISGIIYSLICSTIGLSIAMFAACLVLPSRSPTRSS